MTTESHVGGSPNRSGGVGRVTGSMEYLADIHLPGELHVKLVTLDCGRARINSIDTTKAMEVPGVVAIMTADDLPRPVPRFGPQYRDRPVLAIGETKYHGDPVAAVAAESKDAAEMAVELVEVDYEELPRGVLTVAEALDPGSPLVQDPSIRAEDDPFRETNILREHHYGWGDVDSAEAAHVFEETYEFPMVTHFAIEPHGFMAAPEDGGMTIWSTIQHPYWLQKEMARLLGLPLARVRVHAPDPGGGFGGKQHPKFEPLVAFMARRIGRPCRLILTLEQTFQAVRRSAAQVRVRIGFDDDGLIQFQDYEANFLIGAYADIADRVVGKSSYLSAGPFRVPNVRIVARGLLSHTTPSTAFRGFGVPQITWARESLIDEAARAMGIDALEIRLRNLAKFGEEFIPGETPADGDWAQSVQRAADLIGWGDPLPEGRGRGIAVGFKSGPTTGLSYATVRLLADGSAVLYSGTSDMGQGARTIFAQIVAQELGMPVEDVTVVMGDTSLVPYDQQTSASRSSVLMGNAVLFACRDIQSKIRQMAARVYGVDEESIVVDSGTVSLSGEGHSIREVLEKGLGHLGGELVGNGEMRKDAEPDHPLKGSAAFFEFNCTATELEVDAETGEITLVKYVTVGDVGKSMNPLQVRGQDEGAAVMGLGHTLMEHIILDETGRIRNLGAIDYRILTSLDLPLEMISASVENADGPGPYGAKGVSEGSLLCTAPAVGAALTSATGLVIRDLPLTPERVWRATLERDHDSD